MNMPPLGQGTFRLQGQQAIDAVTNGLAAGYRHIDTAQIYGNEAEVGAALAGSGVARSSVYLTTKIWTANLGANLIDSLKDSLHKLRTDAVDLTLIHWPSPGGAVPLAQSLDALMDARRQGLTGAIGVSNFTVALMQEAIAAVGAGQIATNQVELHPYLQNCRVAAFAREAGIPITAYMPLAYGKVLTEPVIDAIARRHEATAAQVTLAWVLARGYATIPSSTRRANLDSNLEALALRLTPQDMAAIDALDMADGAGRIVNPDFAPVWDIG